MCTCVLCRAVCATLRISLRLAPPPSPPPKNTSQPAVPFAGLFRLIDVPVSNCIHSGISNIYVLTQYNATSLNRHLSRAYQFLNGITFQGVWGLGGGEGCNFVGGGEDLRVRGGG